MTSRSIFLFNLLLFILVAFSWSASADAACSGSGLTWNCTAGSTTAQVQSAVNSASDEATITFAAGSYSWSNISLNNRNGITLQCASVRACNVSFSGGVFSIDYTPSVRTNLIRISGFVFSGTPGTAAIWFAGANNINKLRIDNNTFSNFGAGNIAIMVGATDDSTTGYVYGVIDHNIFSGTNAFMALKALTGKTWVTGLQGSANNIFFEDNTATFTVNNDYGGINDAWMATGIVLRYNNITNARVGAHGECHGGPVNMEIYGNTIANPAIDNYRSIHHQGSGEIMIFNNKVAGGHIALQHYRGDASQMPNGSCTAQTICDGTQTGTWPDGNRSPITTYRGYPCWNQPGRDANLTLRPIYLWGNTDPNDGNSKASLSIESGGYTSLHLQANRDYYEAVSANEQTSPTNPFNGTLGMGFGTLANRPTTCTTNSMESGGGVGYFATDAGTQGTLYRCSATNTWTVHYTPYTYPHPLTQVGLDTESPTVPTNLVATAVSSSRIDLSWTASTDNFGIAGYDIQQCSGSGCTPTGTIYQTTGTGTTYQSTGLSQVTLYRYHVRARDAAGNTSNYSSIAQATTQANLILAPSNFRILQ